MKEMKIPNMNILVAGNLANHGYLLTKLLRNQGISADLLLRKNPTKTEDPKSIDNMEEYPDWIKFWDISKFDWKYQIIKKMRKYDLIHATTEFPIFAYISQKPYIAFSTGADIAKLAKENSLKGILLRRAYYSAKVVILGSPYQEKYAKELKIKKTIYIPILWDHTKFTVNKNIKKENGEFLIFHPTNHLWDYKKNDRFLKAFVRIARKYDNVRLTMINRGSDFDKSIKIFDEDMLKKKVTIISETLSQKQLVDYYNNSDLIVDQFGVGATGLIGQEVMACGKPLLQYINNEVYKKYYSEVPPILNAQYENEIYQKMSNLIENPNLGNKIGKMSQEWILKYHNHEKIIKKYIYLYDAINKNIKFKKIQEEIHNY